MVDNKKTHISYSELKDWAHCPHYHKKNWIEKVASFEGNEYTAFGTAIHDVCEKKLLRENIDEEKVFQIGFDQELQKLAEKNVEANCSSRWINRRLVSVAAPAARISSAASSLARVC